MKNVSVALSLCAAAMVLTSCSCILAPARTVAVDNAKLGPKRPVESVALIHGDAGGTKVASISSIRDTKFTEPEINAMLADLRKQGAQAGVDAVTNIRVLHDWRRGFINNPRTPFYSRMQGTENLYFLRGDGVRFADGKAPAAREAKASDFAGQPLPKGRLTQGQSSTGQGGSINSMLPGSSMALGTAPYVNSVSTKN